MDRTTNGPLSMMESSINQLNDVKIGIRVKYTENSEATFDEAFHELLLFNEDSA